MLKDILLQDIELLQLLKQNLRKIEFYHKKRAETVLGYMSNIIDPAVLDNKTFIKEAFVPEGKSSTSLVLNEDGSENVELSRRVEFRIETNPNK